MHLHFSIDLKGHGPIFYTIVGYTGANVKTNGQYIPKQRYRTPLFNPPSVIFVYSFSTAFMWQLFGWANGMYKDQ